MKFCTRIINKKKGGGDKSAIVPTFRFILVSFRNTSLECNLEPLSHINLRTTRGFVFKSYHVNYNEKSTNMITFNRLISFLTLFFIFNTPISCNIGKCFNASNTLVAPVAPDDKQTHV